MGPGEQKIERFSVVDRVVHWLVALSFLYAALTGLALWSPRLYWLASLFGGGPTVRAWHPLGALAFSFFFSTMYIRWQRPMRLDADDRMWLRFSHRFIFHEEWGLLESGRFNGGQKALFWVQATSGFVLLASGIVLWWVESMPRGLRLAAVLLHPIAAVVSIAGIIVHIYMGAVAVPEALRGMVQGWVTSRWAATHHPKWLRELSRD